MGGLFILFLLGLYIWGAYKIVRWIRPVWGKAFVVVAVLLIPTADAVYGRIRLKHMCEAEGGLKIYKTVEGVEGFRDGRSRPEEEWITKYGYRFVEGEGANGTPARVSRQANGTIIMENNVTPISKFAFEHSGGDFARGYAQDEIRVRDLATNEILARNLNISYQGGWVERFVASVYAARGFAGACQEGGAWISPTKIVSETLKPSK